MNAYEPNNLTVRNTVIFTAFCTDLQNFLGSTISFTLVIYLNFKVAFLIHYVSQENRKAIKRLDLKVVKILNDYIA